MQTAKYFLQKEGKVTCSMTLKCFVQTLLQWEAINIACSEGVRSLSYSPRKVNSPILLSTVTCLARWFFPHYLITTRISETSY